MGGIRDCKVKCYEYQLSFCSVESKSCPIPSQTLSQKVSRLSYLYAGRGCQLSLDSLESVCESEYRLAMAMKEEKDNRSARVSHPSFGKSLGTSGFSTSHNLPSHDTSHGSSVLSCITLATRSTSSQARRRLPPTSNWACSSVTLPRARRRAIRFGHCDTS